MLQDTHRNKFNTALLPFSRSFPAVGINLEHPSRTFLLPVLA